MVGVPGRAKSCGTCRIRKKGGCDMAKPACGQCVDRGLKCDGYQRQAIFINTTARPVAPQTRLVPAPEGSGSLARSAYEEKYFGAFFEAYLPQSRQLPLRIMSYTGGGWTNALPQLSRASPTVRNMLLAFGLTTAGHVCNRAEERREGLRYYTGSLRDMSAAVAAPNRVSDPMALCLVARLYSLYEVIFGHDEQDELSQARSWRKHIHGELALVTAQPPEAYTSGYPHLFFVDGRYHLTTGAIVARKKTALSSPEWKTIPWRCIPKTPKDLLLDTFVEMPGLLQDVDEMRADPPGHPTLRHELVRRCWRYESELSAWRARAGIADPAYRLELGVGSPPALDLVAASHILCVYWSMCIIVYSTLHSLSADKTTLPERANPRVYCRRIAEAVPVLLHPRSGAYGMHLANFPAAIALVYLNAADGGGVASEERGIILRAFERSVAGKTAGHFIASAQRAQPRPGG
ncbi:hypothetical protein B0H67DRAFT_92482 [Lasiosphaeris hirsuta]|uniref:Zn(2)-C6 fungal-type domain-containing protein n=1 Tax=Lasiosphaeris hirsuta TaxID=260670 RepID=A0AA40EE62_9PEZI|nr:hypothetical protein B0H67DRAFT_92482 [Lasiosphaeris hirsuta]